MTNAQISDKNYPFKGDKSVGAGYTVQHHDSTMEKRHPQLSVFRRLR
jgi:hypothetical protein